MAYYFLLIYTLVASLRTGGTEGLVLNETAAEDLILSMNNKELLKYATLTGKSYYLQIELPRQTLITQHAANLTLDCGSLLDGKYRDSQITWSALYDGAQVFKDISPDGRSSNHGLKRSHLTFHSNIYNSAGDGVGISGIYKCEICTEKLSARNCLHRNITMLVIGTAPALDVVSEKSESYRKGHNYKIGSQFCLKRNHSNTYCNIFLQCNLLNGKTKTLAPAIPSPHVRWMLNDEVIYYDTEYMINTEFLMADDNMLLSPGLVYPTPLTFSISLDYIIINLCQKNISNPELLPEGIDSSNLHDKMFDLILGSWTCLQNNSFGSSSATTTISECGIYPSFELKQYIVNESNESIPICIRHFFGVENIIIHSRNIEAEASKDFILVNVSWSIRDTKPCFKVYLIDDNQTENIESFELYMDIPNFEVKPSSTTNRTLTIIIRDDDHVNVSRSPLCSLDSHLLVTEVYEENEVILEKIAEKILVKQIFPNISLDTHNIERTYEQIADILGKKYSTEGFTLFVNALDTIYESYASSCIYKISEIPVPSTLSELAEEFKLATSIYSATHALAQDIFGKFLCFSELETIETVRTRLKRQIPIDIFPPTTCTCPDVQTKSCHFFACLNVSKIEILLRFGNVYNGFPCIAFIVDTTGSMREEIQSTQNVILQFLKAQEDTTSCYMLVPFNDHDHDYDYSTCGFDGTESNTGPISSSYSYAPIHDLKRFEDDVLSLEACGGGDFPEFALSAILEALNYTVINSNKDSVRLMANQSHMVLITDAESKFEDLTSSVINLANNADVSISFIISEALADYEPYVAIANSTNGILHTSDLKSITWPLAAFALEWGSRRSLTRTKRSAAVSEILLVAVSVFSRKLRILSSCRRQNNVIIIHPNKTREKANITDHTLIYLNAEPQPGVYQIDFCDNICDTQSFLDTYLNTKIVFLNENFSASTNIPPPACTSVKLAVTSINLSKINSLSLDVTNPEGYHQLVHLTKCSNAFIMDYDLQLGKYVFNFFGLDIDNIKFNYSPNIDFTFNNNNVYLFQGINESKLTMEYTDTLSLMYELHSSIAIGSSNFSFSPSNIRGFDTSITPSSVVLLASQRQVITLTTRIVSLNIPGGSTHQISIYADNGCVTLLHNTLVTVNPKAKIPPKLAETNECNCLNGGTCVIVQRGRRRSRICRCSPEFRGSTCQTPN